VSLDAKKLRHNWWSEARIASIYTALAGVASEGAVRRRLEGLAADEDRHASAWAALAESAGVAVGPRRPWAAAFVLALLARLLGVGRVLGLAGIAEGRVLRSYLGQVVRDAEGEEQALLRALIPEETGHLGGSEGSAGSAGSAGSGGEEEDAFHGTGVESIRNVIYGVNDGLTATLGVLAGVGGATVNFHVVLVGGLAAMTASAVSMAGGAYLATKSQREIFEEQLAREAAEIEAMPELEREELKEIYLGKGLTPAEAEVVVSRITADKQVWLETLAKEELGLDVSQFEEPRREAVVAGVSTLVGGAIPVLGYVLGRLLVPASGVAALVITFGVCLVFLFLIGSARSFFTGKGGLRSGLEMMGVGTVVAVVTYLVGVLFKSA